MSRLEASPVRRPGPIATWPERLYGDLPFPIAIHVHGCQTREAWLSSASRAHHLGRALEALIRYLTLAAVSDYLRQGAFESKVNDLLLRGIRAPNLTLGRWLELLREVVRCFLTAGRESRPAPLTALLFVQRGTKFKPSDFLHGLDKLVAYRNETAHAPWVSLARTIDEHYADFGALLEHLRFLGEYPLVVLSSAMLTEVSERLKSSGEREVIVFDGLDYLSPDAPTGFLFDVLPPRVFFVLFARRCRLLEKLQGRVQSTWAHLPLGGLKDEDAYAYLEQAQLSLPDAERERAVGQAAGLPFSLDRVVRNVRAGLPWTNATANLDELYRQALEQAYGSGSEGVVEQVLGLLCVAREPLSALSLATIARISPRQVRAVLEQIEHHLLIIRQEVTLFHESFRDFLRQELPPGRLRQCTEEIVRWTNPPDSGTVTP